MEWPKMEWVTGVIKLFHPYKWSSWPLYPLTVGIVRIFQAAVSRDKSNSRRWNLGGGFKDISSSNHPFFRGKLAVSFRDSNLNGKLGGGFKDFDFHPYLGKWSWLMFADGLVQPPISYFWHLWLWSIWKMMVNFVAIGEFRLGTMKFPCFYERLMLRRCSFFDHPMAFNV